MKSMGYKGFIKPISHEDCLPTVKRLLKSLIEDLPQKAPEMIPRDDVIEVLKMCLNVTEPELGYFYCPYLPLKNQPNFDLRNAILTKYGKKLLEHQNIDTQQDSSQC